MHHLPKAESTDFAGRFREIISDPINFLIRRHPRAGYVDNNLVCLHNGLMVPVSGPHAYYGGFSTILVLNRGVHEPLEEFVFQQLLNRLPQAPRMLELGAYWGHYSMWLKQARPGASVHLVEPEPANILAGKHNFQLNGFTGTFLQAFVSRQYFGVDRYLEQQGLTSLDVLHADIQGFEMEMLEGAQSLLGRRAVDYLFVSTHSQELHDGVVRKLADAGYRVEVSSDFESGTTSFDGFVFASSSAVPPLFQDFKPLSRVGILGAGPAEWVAFLAAAVSVSG